MMKMKRTFRTNEIYLPKDPEGRKDALDKIKHLQVSRLFADYLDSINLDLDLSKTRVFCFETAIEDDPVLADTVCVTTKMNVTDVPTVTLKYICPEDEYLLEDRSLLRRIRNAVGYLIHGKQGRAEEVKEGEQ